MALAATMGSREATELVIARTRARPKMVGAAVFGTALTAPFAASAAWATNTCACGGAPTTAPPAPPPDVRGMSADAAERWLESSATPTPAHQPVPPPPASAPPPSASAPPPVEEPELAPPTGTTTTTIVPSAVEDEPEPAPPAEPATPTRTTTTTPAEEDEPAPDVRGMSPDAAERWLESAEEPAAAPPPAAADPAPPTGTTNTIPPPAEEDEPEEDEPEPDVRGMSPDAAERWLESAEEPAAEPPPSTTAPAIEPIPPEFVVEPELPPEAACERVEGVDEDDTGLCVYDDGRTSTTEDPERTPAPVVEDLEELAQDGRGEELLGELTEASDEEFEALVEEATIGLGATNRSYFPIEPAPGDGVVVIDFFIAQDRSVFLRGDDRELQDPVRSDLELTDSRITLVMDRENGRGVVTQSETCTVGIEICQTPRPIELGPEDNREQSFPSDPNEFDVRTDEETISVTYDALNSITPEGWSVDGTVRLRRRPDGLYEVIHDTRDDYPAISIWQYRPGDTPRLIDYDRGEHVLWGAPPDCDLPDLPDGPNLPNLPAADLPGSWFDFDLPDLSDIGNAPNLSNLPGVPGLCR